jgi:hypothetical protein
MPTEQLGHRLVMILYHVRKYFGGSWIMKMVEKLEDGPRYGRPISM